MDGILLIDKEQGWTSFDVVAKLRGVFGQKKIGHTGTLDPDATGVLTILLGKATKLSDKLMSDYKTYATTLKLGVTTNTEDMSGEIICEKEVNCSVEDIKKTANLFVGDIDQIPPMYSAIKINGVKLYKLARSGKEIEREPRHIHINSIDICDINLPYVSMKVNCSKGTYIRTLCSDMGNALGCGAAMDSLRRTHAGAFAIEKTLKIGEVVALSDEIKKQFVSNDSNDGIDMRKVSEEVRSEIEAMMISALGDSFVPYEKALWMTMEQ